MYLTLLNFLRLKLLRQHLDKAIRFGQRTTDAASLIYAQQMLA
jgi:hypothetical protein